MDKFANNYTTKNGFDRQKFYQQSGMTSIPIPELIREPAVEIPLADDVPAEDIPDIIPVVEPEIPVIYPEIPVSDPIAEIPIISDPIDEIPIVSDRIDPIVEIPIVEIPIVSDPISPNSDRIDPIVSDSILPNSDRIDPIVSDPISPNSDRIDPIIPPEENVTISVNSEEIPPTPPNSPEKESTPVVEDPSYPNFYFM